MNLVTQGFTDAFAAQEGSLGPAWFHDRRRDAMDAFTRLGWPTTRDERWRYSNVRSVQQTVYHAPEPTAVVSPAAVAAHRFPGAACLVFVDGELREDLSDRTGLPDDIIAGSLRDAPEAAVHDHFAKVVPPEEHAFTALNTALWTDGAYLHVPKDTVVKPVVQVLWWTNHADGPVATHPRTLLVLDAHAEVDVVESFAGAGGPTLTNAVTEAALGPGAHLRHTVVQEQEAEAWQFHTMRARQDRDSTFRSMRAELGGHFVRSEVLVGLDAQGASCRLDGLYLGAGTQHVDTWTHIDHKAPHTTSSETYKGILTDKAHGAFTGHVVVRPGAQKIRADQTNKNLLLSDSAHADSTPQLEIHADDVQCSHGSTIGQLDPDQVFFLRARGLGGATARRILTQAFAADVVRALPQETLRERIEGKISQWFSQHVEGA